MQNHVEQVHALIFQRQIEGGEKSPSKETRTRKVNNKVAECVEIDLNK